MFHRHRQHRLQLRFSAGPLPGSAVTPHSTGAALVEKMTAWRHDLVVCVSRAHRFCVGPLRGTAVLPDSNGAALVEKMTAWQHALARCVSRAHRCGCCSVSIPSRRRRGIIGCICFLPRGDAES